MGEIIKFKSGNRKFNIRLIVILAAAAVTVCVLTAWAISMVGRGKVSDPIKLDSTRSYRFDKYDGGAVICGGDSVCALDASGKQKWETAITYDTPILDTSGKYVLVAEKSGTGVMLIYSGKTQLNFNLQNTIITAAVSKSGYFVIVTDENGYNARVSAFSPKGEEVYTWHTSKYNILDADISDNGKAIGVGVLCGSESNDLSGVMMFNFGSKDGTFVAAPNNSLVSKVMYNGNILTAIGDINTFGTASNGKIKYNIDYEGKNLRSYGFSKDGVLTLCFDNASGSDVCIYNKSGKQTGYYQSNRQVIFMDTNGSNTIINSENGAAVINSRGKQVSEFKIDNDINSALLISGNRKMLGITGDSARVYTCR